MINIEEIITYFKKNDSYNFRLNYFRDENINLQELRKCLEKEFSDYEFFSDYNDKNSPYFITIKKQKIFYSICLKCSKYFHTITKNGNENKRCTIDDNIDINFIEECSQLRLVQN